MGLENSRNKIQSLLWAYRYDAMEAFEPIMLELKSVYQECVEIVRNTLLFAARGNSPQEIREHLARAILKAGGIEE